MKKIFFVATIILFTNSFLGLTQNKNQAATNEFLYQDTEQGAVFPGGNSELSKFIMSNLRYPSSAIDNQIKGRVIVRFCVKTDGNVDDIELIRPLTTDCNEEVIRVINAMPKWTPAKNKDGDSIATFITLPVDFKF